MIKKLVQHGELGDLRKLLSTSFFDVMSKRDVAVLIRTFYRNYRDSDRFSAVLEDTRRRISAAGLDLSFIDASPATGAEPDTLLRLYFLQLFDSAESVLDLRYAKFGTRGPTTLWAPAPVYYAWDPEFRDGICEMYRSFYVGDEQGFQHALEQLGLRPAEDLFRRHFGDGDQTSVAFELSEFTETFRFLFERCRDAGVTLHRDFGALGVYLASLYEHLETLGGSHDVRTAAIWAIQRPIADADTLQAGGRVQDR